MHATLALLLGTFTYSVTVLRSVRASLAERAAFVPHLSVTVAYLLGVASVLMLVVFLAHLARQIRVESMLREVHAETTVTMCRAFADVDDEERPGAGVPEAPDTATPVCATSSGFITFIDLPELMKAVESADAVVLIDRAAGDSLIAGTPVGFVWPRDAQGGHDAGKHAGLAERVVAAVHTGYERTPVQDIRFGLRQLVDVAVKALSPGINDPTTAVHALAHVSALLCDAARLPLGPIVQRDGEGVVRVVVHRPGFDTLLSATMGTFARYGGADPDVLARLFMLLREVAWCTSSPARRAMVSAHFQRLRRVAARESLDEADRERMAMAATQVEDALAGRWRPAG